MSLYVFEFAFHQIAIEVKAVDSSRALHLVSVDGALVAQSMMATSELAERAQKVEHQFAFSDGDQVQLAYEINAATGVLFYRLWINHEQRSEGFANPVDNQAPADGDVLTLAKPVAGVAVAAPAKGTWLSLGLIAFKLLQTVKVVKVALAAATLAVYSVMFTVEFAVALIGILVFHEYGHLRAMKKFGIPTKGMYLIPFVGGMAVGDKPGSQWQDVYISLMGPVYGLLMTVVFYIVYLLTSSHFAGLVASTSALVNLFNLIPVYPLDGGRVVKALVFSGRNYLGLVALLVISALCFVWAWKLGFFFITFFIVLGVVDILSSWRVPLDRDIVPLKPYGIAFSAVWYLGVVAVFMGMIMLIAKDRLPGAEIAIKILSS